MKKAINNLKAMKHVSLLNHRKHHPTTLFCNFNNFNNINNNRINQQRREIGLILFGSLLAASSFPLWNSIKQVNETRNILKKADESIHWPFAQGVVKSVQLEEGKILFGLTNAYKLNIQYEYKLGTSQYYQKHPSGSGYRKIDINTDKRVSLDERNGNLFIPLMPPSIDPEESLVIISGKPRIFNNDRVFWTVPYWLVGGDLEVKNNLLKLAEEFKQDEETLVRINPIDPQDSVLIVGRQSFDQSWKFTFIYLSMMALFSVLLFATSYWALISIVGGEIEIPLTLIAASESTESSHAVDEKIVSNWLWSIVWYVNESYRLFSSVVLNRHQTEALPPSKEKPKFIDISELKDINHELKRGGE